jgi:hypothetical protein
MRENIIRSYNVQENL